MPHSTAPGDVDVPLVDEKPQEELTEQPVKEEEDSQTSNDVDQDMADAEVVGDKESKTNTEIKPEVKLEDLFADMDSDDEFSSSNAKSQEIKSSAPQEVPSSPV
jgi:DNA primase small subunit